MVKAGDKAKGFKFGNQIGGASYQWSRRAYHPDMDLYVGAEGEVAFVEEETFVIKFKNIRNLSGEYDFWHYPIAEYLEIKRSERLSELGI